MTHKIAKIWNRVSYETMIFIAFLIRFLSTRALDLDTWSSAWDAMDYSMGNGSRLLIGSIYKLFYGDYPAVPNYLHSIHRQSKTELPYTLPQLHK